MRNVDRQRPHAGAAEPETSALLVRLAEAGRGCLPSPIDVAADFEPRDVVPPHIFWEPPARYDVEAVESMSWPPGSDESMLRAFERPRNGLQARIAATRASRDLARQYRVWYGTDLYVSAAAIEAMQWHLSSRLRASSARGALDIWELRSHGALLSEILARTLGAEWMDVGLTEPGYWAMRVPPSTRTCPIGRVYGFAARSQREQDLLSYYTQLSA
jgi:hypothetical protein